MTTLAKLAATAKRTELEDTLCFQLQLAIGPDLWERQYRAIPVRRWRWDVAFPARRILVEVDGGTWVNGGHNRGARIEADCEKQTAAAIDGWRTIRVTGDQVRDGRALDWITRALEATT